MKYRIPDRWTRKFHKYDVVDINIYNQKTGIVQERGKINVAEKIQQRNEIEKTVHNKIFNNANTALLKNNDLSDSQIEINRDFIPSTEKKSPVNPDRYDAMSTDVSKQGADEFSPLKPMRDARESL